MQSGQEAVHSQEPSKNEPTHRPVASYKALRVLAIPVLPAMLALAGLRRAADLGQPNVGAYVAGAVVLFSVGIAVLWMLGRTMAHGSRQRAVPRLVLTVVVMWLVAAVMTSAPAWTDGFSGGLAEDGAVLLTIWGVARFGQQVLIREDSDPSLAARASPS